MQPVGIEWALDRDELRQHDQGISWTSLRKAFLEPPQGPAPLHLGLWFSLLSHVPFPPQNTLVPAFSTLPQPHSRSVYAVNTSIKELVDCVRGPSAFQKWQSLPAITRGNPLCPSWQGWGSTCDGLSGTVGGLFCVGGLWPAHPSFHPRASPRPSLTFFFSPFSPHLLHLLIAFAVLSHWSGPGSGEAGRWEDTGSMPGFLVKQSPWHSFRWSTSCFLKISSSFIKEK